MGARDGEGSGTVKRPRLIVPTNLEMIIVGRDIVLEIEGDESSRCSVGVWLRQGCITEPGKGQGGYLTLPTSVAYHVTWN